MLGGRTSAQGSARLIRRPGFVTAGLWFAFLVCFVCNLEATEPRTIVFFGDSLTAGYGLADPEADAYPALIQKKITEANLPWRVINAGLSGETTAGGLRRVDWILRQPADIF